MQIEEIRADSWQTLLDLLFEGSWRDDLRRHRSRLAYRGDGNVHTEFTTSLARLGLQHGARESHLLRNFRKYAHSSDVPRDNHWNWLALARHHGLPTRLIDWTYSPLVAMHFATEHIEEYSCDGVIWCVDFVRTAQLLPPRLRDALRAEGSDVFTTEMLADTVNDLSELEHLSDEPFHLFFEPPALDERIVNQFALFSLLSRADARLTDWMATQPSLCRKVIVAARAKWEIRDKLDQANITERMLYPGLDGLCLWLARYYAARPEQG
jgi:hypothetical protein